MFRSTRWVVVVAAGVAAAGGGGCSSMSNTEKGVGLGGLLGAGTGTLIGAATGNPKTGAVVGGLLGAGVGGLVGNDADNKDKAAENARYSAAAAANALPPLGMMDVVKLSQAKVDPGVICEQIRASNSTFQLSTTDIEYLTGVEVDSRVIRAMQSASGPRAMAPVVRERVIVRESAPVYVDRPVYMAPPPPAMGVYYTRVR